MTHLGGVAVVVEHDLLMATALFDRVITFQGQPGVRCAASAPRGVGGGLNDFLRQLRVTVRRAPGNFRLRINRRGSAIDRRQKAAGAHFVFDREPKPASALLRQAAPTKKEPPRKKEPQTKHEHDSLTKNKNNEVASLGGDIQEGGR